jgi:PIN domain nuclease of toxin-antitoxin system
MRVLLDTNAFLRLVNREPLPRNAQRALTRTGVEVLVSIVTGWEIIMKPELNISATDIEFSIQAMRARTLPISFNHIDEYSRLPAYNNHRDPFDRMLIAQALAEDLTIMSADSRFESYKRLRLIWD